jgi:hypothetical protein
MPMLFETKLFSYSSSPSSSSPSSLDNNDKSYHNDEDDNDNGTKNSFSGLSNPFSKSENRPSSTMKVVLVTLSSETSSKTQSKHQFRDTLRHIDSVWTNFTTATIPTIYPKNSVIGKESENRIDIQVEFGPQVSAKRFKSSLSTDSNEKGDDEETQEKYEAEETKYLGIIWRSSITTATAGAGKGEEGKETKEELFRKVSFKF